LEVTVRLPFAVSLFAAVLILGPAFSPTASAQDAMQLDTAFRDSLQRKPASDGQAAYQDERGRGV